MNRSWYGFAVAAGGALFVFLNVLISPLILSQAGFAEAAASPAFLVRQSLAVLATLFLLAGVPGLHHHQAVDAGRFGITAFALAFLGCALAVAHEWSQIFLVRDLALQNPEALEALENVKGLSLFDLGALLALLFFTPGWLTFSVSMLRADVYSRLGPILVIAGFFVIPIFTAALPGLFGMIPGYVMLGSGWVLLGRELIRDPH